MIVLFIRSSVRPEKRRELSQTLQSIVEQVRKQSGCLNAGFYQDVANENDFLMVEEWATRKDADDHLGSDIFTVLLGAGSLMHRPPEVVIGTVDRPSELPV